MLAPFLTFINQHKLNLQAQSCLLTVSGGVDSVVMMHLFHKMEFPAAVAHCNFGLRGDESEGDEAFVKALAASYGMTFFSKSFDVKTFAKKEAVSTQMAARTLRYDWFENLRAENHYDWIATAHHANDSIETTLLNLARGTGLSGMHGIAGINGRLLRPLLFASKEEILSYANEHSLLWREDRSNDTDDYKRNLLRHKVVPILQQLNPSLEITFNQSAARLKSADNILKETLDAWSESIITVEKNQIRIPIAALLHEQEPVYRLWYILQHYGFAYNQINKILESVAGIPGKIFQSPTHTLLVDRTHFIVQLNANDHFDDIIIPVGQQEVHIGPQFITFEQRKHGLTKEIMLDRNAVCIDFKKLVFPLIIRKWKSGDTFQPLGMKGKRKKLSDFFIDLKLDRLAKENTLILVNGNQEIIWCIGLRLDERYRVEDDTKEVMQVTFAVGE